jgi:tRNA pseudouridine38-40 synthase
VRAYRIAYDGQPYHGFQRQPDVQTVEDTLLEALHDLEVIDSPATVPENYAAAGRTDAGVSALVQTVAFEGSDWFTPSAFNSELPGSIRAWASAAVDSDFHATHHATRREYTYFLRGKSLDSGLAREALDTLAGQHDFHNLTPDEHGTERDLATTLDVDEPWFEIRLTAGGFPRQFVRRAVTLVRQVANGEVPLDRIDRVLSQEPLPGPKGVGPAAPEPLVLTDVEYPGVTFRVDEEAAERAASYFESLRIERETGAQVADSLSAVSPGTTPEE